VYEITSSPSRSPALAAALLLQILPALLFPLRAIALPSLAAPVRSATACPWSQAVRALASLHADNAIVLTQLWYGPEILWRTNMRVVGGPYEIAPALEDTNAAFDGGETASRAVVLRRQVDFILVCGPEKGFAGQLARGEAPQWLQPVTFAPDLPGFHLYRIVNRK